MTTYCGAKTRAGGTCKNAAGFKTDHVGESKCFLHGGKTPIKHGRYSTINRPRIKELLETFKADDDPLGLLPEIELLRALVLDFIERHDEHTEALLAWHASYSPGFAEHYAAWQIAHDKWRIEWDAWQSGWETYRETVESVQGHYKQGWPEPPSSPPPPRPPHLPEPVEFAGKPRQIVDILSAGRFIGEIGAMVERIHKQKAEGSITLVTLDAVLQQFGAELVKAAGDTIADDADRTALLQAVEQRWATIRVPGVRAA